MVVLSPDRLIRLVGRRAAELRRARGLTQEAFAEAAGVSVKYVQAVEQGTQNLSLRSLVKLANLLRVHPRELFRTPRSPPARPGRPKAPRRRRAKS